MATFGFKHLWYHRFNHVVTVNRICVGISCLEIDMGKSCENVFGLTLQKDSSMSVSQELITTQFLLTGTIKVIKASDA